MKIGILTQYYPPETGAPQRRLSELAQRMVDAGHSVVILTAMPNYPTGKIFEGYGGLVRREQRDGIKIIRTGIYPTQKTSFPHRLANYFSFVISSAVFGTFLLERVDYLLVESPPLFLGFSGYWLSRIKRARLIFNVSDLWPESAVRLGVLREGSLSYRLSAWLECFCYRKAFLVTGQSRSILSDIQARFPNKRAFRLSNGVDVSLFGRDDVADDVRQEIALDENTCLVLYAGLHGIAQGLDQVIDAADRLRDDPKLRFVLIGDGPEKAQLMADAKRRDLKNVLFLDRQPADRIPAYLSAADIILVSLKLHIPGAVPSKLYEAMASRKPVMLVATSEPAEIVNTHEAGFAVEPGDIDGLVAALKTLHDQPQMRARFAENGRRTVEEHFNRDTITAGFISYLEGNL